MDQPSQRPQLSVVLPIFNEAECIDDVLRELCGVLDRLPADWSWELLMVDDGSSDATPDLLQAFAAERPGQLRRLTLTRNSGQSAAFCAGFRAARGAWLATLDADGQNDPADIPRLLEELGDADAICGYRANRQDTWSKKYGSKLANGVRNRVLGEDIVDTGCSLKIFRSHLMQNVTPWNGMHRFFGSYFAMQGARIVQSAVNHRARSAGCSKYTNFGRLKKTIRDLRSVAWLKSRYVQIEVQPEESTPPSAS